MSHLVDLPLDAALEEVHHIGDFEVLAQHAQGVDFQRDADRLRVTWKIINFFWETGKVNGGLNFDIAVEMEMEGRLWVFATGWNE